MFRSTATFFLTQGSPYAAAIPRTTIASIITTTPNSFANEEEEEEEWYCGVPGHGVNPVSRFLGWNSGIKIAPGSFQRRYDTSGLGLPLNLAAAWSDTEEPLATVGSVGSCRTFEQNIACIPSSGDEEGNSPTAGEIIIARVKMCNNSAEETDDDIGAPLVRLYSMATIVSINDGVSKLLMNGTLAEPRVPDLPYPLAVESFTKANIRMSLDAVNASRGKSHTVVRVRGISPMGFLDQAKLEVVSFSGEAEAPFYTVGWGLYDQNDMLWVINAFRFEVAPEYGISHTDLLKIIDLASGVYAEVVGTVLNENVVNTVLEATRSYLNSQNGNAPLFSNGWFPKLHSGG